MMGFDGRVVGGPLSLGPIPPHPSPLPRRGEGIVGNGLVLLYWLVGLNRDGRDWNDGL